MGDATSVQTVHKWEDNVLGLVHAANKLGKPPMDMINGFAAKLEQHSGEDATEFRQAVGRVLGLTLKLS